MQLSNPSGGIAAEHITFGQAQEAGKDKIMLNLKNSLWEIFSVAEANKVDVGVGRDMLLANIDKGAPVEGQDWYEGAPNLEYPALHEQWAVMSDAERAAAKQEVADLIGEHYKALCAAWEAGDRQTFAAVLAEGV